MSWEISGLNMESFAPVLPAVPPIVAQVDRDLPLTEAGPT